MTARVVAPPSDADSDAPKERRLTRGLSGGFSLAPDDVRSPDKPLPRSSGGGNKFQTVAVTRTRQTRRPSTVKLFSNSNNPFADPKPAAAAATPVAGRDESRKAMLSSKDGFSMGVGHAGAPDGQSNMGGREDKAEALHELDVVVQYRAREAQLAKCRTAQQPFHFLATAETVAPTAAVTAADSPTSPAAAASLSPDLMPHLDPADWVTKPAMYAEWEKDMMQKLGKVGLIMLGGPESNGGVALTQKEKEERFDLVVSEEPQPPRASRPPLRPMLRQSKSTEEVADNASDVLPLHKSALSVDGEAEAAVLAALARERRKSPRSPEQGRRKGNFQSMTQKVAAQLKKRSLERKKGQDTIAQLARESGESLPDDLTRSGTSSPLLTMFSVGAAGTSGSGSGSINGSGTPPMVLTAGLSPASTPTGSPVPVRHTPSKPKVTSPQSEDVTAKSPATPTQQRRSGRFGSATVRPKRSSIGLLRKDDDGDSGAAFPGLSMRSSDAAAFETLKKTEEQKRALKDPDYSPESANGMSPPSGEGTPPKRELSGSLPMQPDRKAASPTPKLDLTAKLGLRRASTATLGSSKEGADKKAPTTPSKDPKAPVSPKSKRFSGVFHRKTDSDNSSATKVPHIATSGMGGGGSVDSPQLSPSRMRGQTLSSLPSTATAASMQLPPTPILSPRKTLTPSSGPTVPMVNTSAAAMAAAAGLSNSGGAVQATSPRKSGSVFGNQRKVPSPRTSQRASVNLPSFGRRKTNVSPRQPETASPVVSPRPELSPPPSARELVADGLTLEALNNLVGMDASPSASPRDGLNHL